MSNVPKDKPKPRANSLLVDLQKRPNQLRINRAKPKEKSPFKLLAAKTVVLTTGKEKEFRSRSDGSKTDADAEVEQHNYYHGFLPRGEIEAMLKADGDYLVRKTNVGPSNKMVISVWWQGAAQHVILNKTKDGRWCVSEARFYSIPELIDYYVVRKLDLTPTGAKLINPVPRQQWQLTHDQIELKEKLGEGHYGEVYRALIKQGKDNTQVAVKTLRGFQGVNKEDRKKFVNEAQLMRRYKHDNIILFLGVAAQEHPLMIVMEFAPNGSLLSYLRSRGSSLSTTTHVQFSLEAAHGLAYLEANGCIHRDVAARNCLLSADYRLKISDFGLSREQTVYKEKEKRSVPVKWLAPETLSKVLYSTKSDVWSFGVLLWEIFSDGREPYPGLSNAQVRTLILHEQYRMQPPSTAPTPLMQLMRDCWRQEAGSRPSFTQIVILINGVLKLISTNK